MNKIGQRLFTASHATCRSSCNVGLVSQFRFSNLCTPIRGRGARQPISQRQRSTQAHAVLVLGSRSAKVVRSSHLLKHNDIQQTIIINKQFSNQIVEEGVGTYKPSPFQKKILVWGKLYPSVEKVPDRVTRNQMKKAMDKFRVRVSLMMVAATFICSAIVALIGRKQRSEGQSVTRQVLARRGHDVD